MMSGELSRTGVLPCRIDTRLEGIESSFDPTVGGFWFARSAYQTLGDTLEWRRKALGVWRVSEIRRGSGPILSPMRLPRSAGLKLDTPVRLGPQAWLGAWVEVTGNKPG